MTQDATTPGSPSAHGRERCLRAAYDLFCRYGVQSIGVDRIVGEAGVAKMTLYRHFRSKDELVIAALERREQEWTRKWLFHEAERRGRTPEDRLLAMFDAFDEWFRRDDYEGCFFLNTLLENRDRTSAVGARAALGLSNVRTFIRRLAEEASVRNPESFARDWHALLYGSISLAATGDVGAARRAKEVGRFLLHREELGATSGSEPRSSG